MRQKQISKALEKTLKQYAKHGINVLLEGAHGVGKTHIIVNTFNEIFGEQGKDWLYFSASTMDVWVDFIGIPKNYTDIDGKEKFRIIPPEQFSSDTIQALYFDELNRSDDKVRNALMELIQFRSINGRKFTNLKCIWGSVNPHDEEDPVYQVEELDPAQIDRFEVQISLPYDINMSYLKSKYGDLGFFLGKWWRDLKKEQKQNMSPRRLEAAIKNYLYKIGDISDVLPVNIDASSFIAIADMVNTANRLKVILDSDDADKLMKSYLTPNKIETLLPFFENDIPLFKKVMPYIPNEILRSLLEKQYTNLIGVVKDYNPSHYISSKESLSIDMNFTELLINFNKLSSDLLHKKFSQFRKSRSVLNTLLNAKQKNQFDDYLFLYSNYILKHFTYSTNNNSEFNNGMAICFLYHLNSFDHSLQHKINRHYAQLVDILNRNLNHADFITSIKSNSSLSSLVNFLLFSIKLGFFSQIINSQSKDNVFDNEHLLKFIKIVLISNDFRNFINHYNENIQHIHSNIIVNNQNSKQLLKNIPSILKI